MPWTCSCWLPCIHATADHCHYIVSLPCFDLHKTTGRVTIDVQRLADVRPLDPSHMHMQSLIAPCQVVVPEFQVAAQFKAVVCGHGAVGYLECRAFGTGGTREFTPRSSF